MLNHFAFRAKRWVTREEVWTFTRSPVCIQMLCAHVHMHSAQVPGTVLLQHRGPARWCAANLTLSIIVSSLI